MSRITCIFKESIYDDVEYEAKTAKKLGIRETENESPRALIQFDRREYDSIKDCEFCEIYRDGKLFFKGQITYLSLENDTMEIILGVDELGDYAYEGYRQEAINLFLRFKEENPELFTKTLVKERMRTGEAVESDLKKPSEPPLEIDEEVIDGTLKIEESTDMPLSEVRLSIKAAWISRREGSVNLSTKLENRFKMARVNTLTPRKLEDSWPEFGDRIRSKGAVPTKYMISSSRLRESEQQFFPAITIDDLIPQLKLKKHIYENRLQLSWDYDQYMNETVDISIFSNIKSRYKNTKSINFNLGNVQEYMESPSDTSFFRSKTGNDILNGIIKSIGDYIALSWRNIEASFEVIENEKTAELTCKDWIKLRGKNYKITQIEREIDSDHSLMKIKARAFGTELPSRDFINSIELKKEKPKPLTPEDIIEDIVVHNEADVQYEKLLRFISEKKEPER